MWRSRSRTRSRVASVSRGCWTTTTCCRSRPARFGDHPAIQAAYAARFKLVMVDEFQDTDQLQVDMIKRMAGEGLLAHVHRRRRAAEHLPVPRRGRVGVSPPSGGCAPPQPRGHHRAARQLPQPRGRAGAVRPHLRAAAGVRRRVHVVGAGARGIQGQASVPA